MDDQMEMTHEGLDFTEDELKELRGDSEQSLQADAKAVVGDEAAEKPAEQQVAAEVKAPPQDAKPPSEMKAALRAARRGEQRAKNEVGQLRRQVAELQAKVPTAQAEDVDMEALEADFPQIAKTLKVMQAKIDAVPVAQAAEPAQEQTEFEPQMFPPEMQDDIDSTPDLLAWQHDPDQTTFEIAKAEDAKLTRLPKWQDKSRLERFAEVVRRVNLELADSVEPTKDAPAVPAAKPKVNVAEAIQRAERIKPNTLSDIGGGDTPASTNNLSRYAGMSNEDIEADLLMG